MLVQEAWGLDYKSKLVIDPSRVLSVITALLHTNVAGGGYIDKLDKLLRAIYHSESRGEQLDRGESDS